MTWLWITADDVWLFRDGRPFDNANNHTARSVFPPTPLTVQGALRAAVLAQYTQDWNHYHEDENLVQMIGTPDLKDLGKFHLSGPFLAHYDETVEQEQYYRYTPLPADLVATKDGQLLTREPSQDATWDLEYNLAPLLLPFNDVEVDGKATADLWLREDKLDAYFEGRPLSLEECDKSETLFTSEHRLGIGLDYKSGRSADQMLYRVQFINPCHNVGLVVEVSDALNYPHEGKLALGGEYHSATFQAIDNIYHKQQPLTNRVKIVFQTPAFFEAGFCPANNAWVDLFEPGLTPRLIAVALHRSVPIGGWNTAGRHPRPISNFVAPGSVYYFEFNDIPKKLPDAITQNPPGIPNAYGLGFGRFVYGPW